MYKNTSTQFVYTKEYNCIYGGWPFVICPKKDHLITPGENKSMTDDDGRRRCAMCWRCVMRWWCAVRLWCTGGARCVCVCVCGVRCTGGVQCCGGSCSSLLPYHIYIY